MTRTLIVTALAAFLLGLPTAGSASGTAVHNDYCSPSGDYCLGVDLKKPPVTLGISSFSFRGRYQVCTRYSRVHAYSCHTFRLRPQGHGIYGSAVLFQRFFPHRRHGRYLAQWRQGGFQIGQTIWFRW